MLGGEYELELGYIDDRVHELEVDGVRWTSPTAS